MAGDREVLPTIRALLDQTPALWEEARSLAMQVERAWLRVLAAENLVSQEILARQLGMMKDQLAGPVPTPLEQLLVERIVVCWLQVQQLCCPLFQAVWAKLGSKRRVWEKK